MKIVQVDIDFQPDSKGLKLHCTVVKVETNKELCWKYHIMLPGLFRGEHSFTTEKKENNRIRFIEREIYEGLLIPLWTKDIDTNSKHGFEEMDKALKANAEADQ
jgi:hypothetical protein